MLDRVRGLRPQALVLSPEEEYALSGGLHGDPQAEGYDAMEDEVFGSEPKA